MKTMNRIDNASLLARHGVADTDAYVYVCPEGLVWASGANLEDLEADLRTSFNVCADHTVWSDDADGNEVLTSLTFDMFRADMEVHELV